jgi:hypothetical protein
MPLGPLHDDDIQMIEDCEKRESKLSDWERGFIDSISAQTGAGRSLTESQCDKLTEIWERVTS